jgi:hypothetical protein
VEAEGRRTMGLASTAVRHDNNNEVRSAHGREERDNCLWEGVKEVKEAPDLQLLGRGRQKRGLPPGWRPAAEREQEVANTPVLMPTLPF